MATRLHSPPHPSEVSQDTALAEGRISVSEFARELGVPRVAVSRVVNGRAAVSADMALRLAAALGARRNRGSRCKRPTTRGKPPSTER